jgi:RimJ/RimL family protein N-acetyltransferase
VRVGSEHLPQLAEMNADPRVMRWIGGVGTAEESRDWLADKQAHWREHGFGVWALDESWGRHEFVGRAGLQYIDVDGAPQVELLYALRPEHWGKGYATEVSSALLVIAFQVLCLPEVVAVALPSNRRSRHVLEKLGFAYEREVLHDGERNAYYRLLAEEWTRRGAAAAADAGSALASQ